MTISPRYSIWLSIILAIVAYMSGAGAQLTDLGLDAAEVKFILAINLMVLGIGNSVNAVLGMIPSGSTKSDLAKFPLGPKAP